MSIVLGPTYGSDRVDIIPDHDRRALDTMTYARNLPAIIYYTHISPHCVYIHRKERGRYRWTEVYHAWAPRTQT